MMTKKRERNGASKPYGQLFWDRLDIYPPILCRLLARVPRGRPLSTVEIADKGGLQASQVDAISQQTDWRGVDLPTARAFMVGCGTDLSNRTDCRRIRAYLRVQPKHPASRFAYLKQAPEWKSHYLPLLERFVKHLNSNANRI